MRLVKRWKKDMYERFEKNKIYICAYNNLPLATWQFVEDLHLILLRNHGVQWKHAPSLPVHPLGTLLQLLNAIRNVGPAWYEDENRTRAFAPRNVRNHLTNQCQINLANRPPQTVRQAIVYSRLCCHL